MRVRSAVVVAEKVARAETEMGVETEVLEETVAPVVPGIAAAVAMVEMLVVAETVVRQALTVSVERVELEEMVIRTVKMEMMEMTAATAAATAAGAAKRTMMVAPGCSFLTWLASGPI